MLERLLPRSEDHGRLLWICARSRAALGALTDHGVVLLRAAGTAVTKGRRGTSRIDQSRAITLGCGSGDAEVFGDVRRGDWRRSALIILVLVSP